MSDAPASEYTGDAPHPNSDPRVGVSVTEVLDHADGVLVAHRRVLARAGATEPLDHLLASRAGAFLMQERSWPGSFSIEAGSLIRHRTGPGGQWARGAENERLDMIRRAAEAVEGVVSRPVDPVLVLTGGGGAAFTGPVTVRGVLVLQAPDLPHWLASLPARVDRAEMALTAARMERACAPADKARRIPDWQLYNTAPRPSRRSGHGRGPVPVRSAPGPRDYWLPTVIEPHRACAPPTKGRRRRWLPWALATIATVGSLLGVIPVHGFPGWDILPRLGSGAPGVTPAVTVSSCTGVQAARVSAIVGRTLYVDPASTPSDCRFLLSPGSPTGPVLAIAAGQTAVTAMQTSGTPMWSLTYPSGSAAPDGSGRLMGAPLRVSVSPVLTAGSSSLAQTIAQAVSRETLATDT